MKAIVISAPNGILQAQLDRWITQNTPREIHAMSQSESIGRWPGEIGDETQIITVVIIYT